jgi:small subunit ribosomal protein S1
MSWSKRVRHPSKIVSIGDEVDVIVLAIDQETRRISLGMKQLEPNPWEVVQEKYHVGDIIRGKIRNITDFGVFVGIEEGIDGLIHISDISWTERISHPNEKFEKTDEVEAKILQIDTEGEKFSLGIKQLTEDPFIKFAADHPVGSKAKGTVSKVADFGAFVTLAEGIEGMIHVSELAVATVSNPADVCKEGDEIEFVILAKDMDERKFSLSKKALEQGLEGDSLKEYIATTSEPKTLFAAAFSKAEDNKKDGPADAEATEKTEETAKAESDETPAE